jgi:hypothetical protein
VRHFTHKECGKSHHRFLAHQMLFNDHGILHRDISLNNILLYRLKDDESGDGLLIDFDYSEELDILDSDGEHAMGECEATIDEAADVEESEARTDEAADMEESEAAGSGIDSIRTVRSHL